MDYHQLLASLRQGEIGSLYLFFGSETYLVNQLVKELENYFLAGEMGDFNYDLFDGELINPEMIVETASLLPVFTDKRLVIVRNTPWFAKKDQATTKLLQEYLEQPSPTTTLVFLAQENVDKRLKLYRTLAKNGIAWESKPMDDRSLRQFIQERLQTLGVKITPSALQIIVMGHQGDLRLLVNELEKLALYTEGKKIADEEDVREVMVFGDQNNIFALTDAVGTKKKDQALWLLRQMLEEGEIPLYILSMLARQLRLILQAKALSDKGYSQNQVIAQIKGHSYPIRKALGQSRHYQERELISALEKTLETDMAIKRGLGEPTALLEQLVLDLCS